METRKQVPTTLVLLWVKGNVTYPRVVLKTMYLVVKKIMTQKLAKITVDIRAKLKVTPQSLEAQIDEYLRDIEAIPYDKHKLIIAALRTHYLPLVNEYQGATPEKLRQSLVDINREWQLHFQYLQQRLGIYLDSELPTVAPTPIYPVEEQKVPPKPVSSKPQLELVKEHRVLEDEEEGEYPDCFKD